MVELSIIQTDRPAGRRMMGVSSFGIPVDINKKKSDPDYINNP